MEAAQIRNPVIRCSLLFAESYCGTGVGDQAERDLTTWEVEDRRQQT